ncbi:hypothetical protein VE01_04518 [Pseudogymnoascus verrucosus]|uniref:Uncharacterized protein n=1 Tax=Pseudogymnoascus verrucosus TaxID=342668 RepID=A0A1B8GNS6_9PEZI|nr:uncharacterized protein VE01_04518 [Pseudogymnoascus verrucosus]OBT97503.1 hypothetical protein VE01_04518 [Pseudogymnoascus verrucosus]
MDSSSVATPAEDARPNLNSDGGEAPSTDEVLQEIATPTHQSDAADPAAVTGNNEQSISHSDAVSAGENLTVTEEATPSRDSNSGNNTAVDGGQQEPDTRIHQSDTADAATATSSNDGGTREIIIQSDSLTRSQNVTETESATTVPNVDLGLVDNGVRVEKIPINNGPPSQSDGRLPLQSDAELDTERNLEPGSALGAEPDAQPAQELDPAADLVPDPESGPAPSPEEEQEEEDDDDEDETRDTYKVRLAQISSEDLTSREVELNQAFGQAIVDGNLEKFIRLLGEGAKIDSRFDDDEEDGDPNQTTLFLAARHDWPEIAAKILELKYDKDFLLDDETNGWTAAHIAAQNNNIDVLRQILEAGDRIGIKHTIVNFENRDKETPLLLAAREDCLDIVNMLLDNDADWKIESTNEGTPLHSAAYHGSKKTFGRLLAIDGAKNLIGKQDNDGWTVLHSAARGGVEVDSLLGDESILKVVTKRTQSTPLLIAALNGKKDILISLLKAGSDLLAKTNDGRTVLHMAAESGSVETLEELVGKLDRDTILWKDDKGGTALSVAATEQEYDAVCFLMGLEAFALPRLKLGSSAKMNQRDVQEVRRFFIDYFEDKSESELDSLMHWHLVVHWAVYYGWQSVARTCFNRQGNLCDLKTKSGETLLHVAACNGYPGVLEQLMDCFKKRGSMETNVMAKISDKTNDEIIPLHFAAGNGYVDTMTSLLEGSVSDEVAAKSKNDKALLYKESWAQILVESRNGETALYFAARNGHQNAVSFLLRWLEKHSELQKIIRKKTKDGKTPLSQAADNGHQGVAKTLLEVLTEHDFGRDSKVAWDELTEVARTGLEEYVELIVDKKILAPNILDNGPQGLFPDQKWTGLLWAVYYGHYKVVWWLLRRNGPTILTSPIFEDATDMVDTLLTKLNNTASLTLEVKSEKERQYREIKDCLYSPPRVENVYDQYDPDGFPSVPQPSGKKEMVCKKYRATIVDFYNKAGHVSFAALSRTMLETIYDKSLTLDEIMTGAGMDRKEPKSLNKASGVDQPIQNAVGNPIATEAPAAGAADAEAPAVPPATRQPAPETPAAGTQKHAAATRQEQNSKKKDVHEDGYRFRWIHVPANNMEWIEDLLSRSFSTNKEHRPVSNFVRGNRHELQSAYADKSGVYQFSRSMKPLCTRQPLKTDPERNMQGNIDPTSRGEVATKLGTNTVPNTEQVKSLQGRELGAEMRRTSSGVSHIALYMPYLTFSKANLGNGASVQLPNSLVDAYGRETIHELRTLDRYYYSSLPEEDVQKRNGDQVLTKYITLKKEENSIGRPRDAPPVDQQHVKKKPRNRQHKNPKENQHKKSEEDQHNSPRRDETGLILQVDQLWLWVIDGDKIITSSSYQTDGEPDIILKRVFKHLIDGRDHDRHPPSSPEQLMQLIVSSATGVIEQRKVILPEKKLSLSILEIFENAIGDVEDGELKLFSKFKETLNKNNSTDEGYSIDEEIGYLVLIKDILDELNILKSLIKDQKKVWHDAFSEYTTEIKSLTKDPKKGWHDAFSEYTMEKDYLNSREPGEILEMLEEMITDATRVERSINDLLDLKQKQANLSEAQSSRKQAEETAMQGTTLMVFTIVTIVFVSYLNTN